MQETAISTHMPATLNAVRRAGVQGRLYFNVALAFLAWLVTETAPAALLGMDGPILAFGMDTDWGPGYAAASPECAARWAHLQASRIWLAGMAALGIVLQGVSEVTLLHAANRLQRSAGTPTDAGRERFIAKCSKIIFNCTTAGKLLVHPITPWVLLSHALFAYQCMDPHQGWIKLILSALVTNIYMYAVAVYAW